MAATTVAIKLIAEFLGAFLHVLSIFASGGNFLVIGLVIALIVFLIDGISSAAVNPAVSFAMWYNGLLSGEMFAYYSVAQFLGGIAAAYSYKIVG